MDTCLEFFYHFIWATKRRRTLITEDIEPRLHDYIRCKCKETRVHVYAVNAMPDHVHLAYSVPPALSVAGFLKGIKGGSAHFISQLPEVWANV